MNAQLIIEVKLKTPRVHLDYNAAMLVPSFVTNLFLIPCSDSSLVGDLGVKPGAINEFWGLRTKRYSLLI